MASILWLKFKRMRTEASMYVIMISLALVLTFVFGNALFGSNNIQRVYISDNDHSDVTETFLDTLGTGTYSLELIGEKEAEISVAKGETMAAIVIPKGFGESLKKGTATLTLVKTADIREIMALENAIRSASSRTAHIYSLQSTLADTVAGIGIAAPSAKDVEQKFSDRMGEYAAVTIKTGIVGAAGFDEAFATDVHFLMGFNIFFVMFSIVFTIGSILEDKKLNTWNRIRISPLSGTAVLAGNFIPTFLIGIVQMAIVLFLGQLLFSIDFGENLMPIFLVFIVFGLTATCLGLLLSTLFNTYEQMNAGMPVILVATAMLGGCMWPLSVVGSDILLGVANAMPQKWVLEAVESLAVYGGGLGSVINNILVLAGMALVFFAISVVLYNKKLRA
ncbi:MAG: ABC transporter permease [Christensenellales bacterium]|jgi:ABC-2 type transport system permease protein